MKQLRDALFAAASLVSARAIDIDIFESFERIALEEQWRHNRKKPRKKIDFVCGRTFFNSIGRAVYQCADWVWQDPEINQYRIWEVCYGDDGIFWCKSYVTMEQFQNMVRGLRYTDDPEQIKKLEDDIEKLKERFQKRLHRKYLKF